MAEKKTKVKYSDYEGHPIFTIYPITDEGELGRFQIIGFGLGKAKAILKHVDELKAWVSKHEGESENEQS